MDPKKEGRRLATCTVWGPDSVRVNEDEAIGNRPFLERNRRDTPYLDINLDYIEESDGGPMGAVKGFEM